MSYCVHCGVKLESSLHTCPLCHTPVVNPNDPYLQFSGYSPFSDKKGVVEPVRRRDAGIWLSIVLFSSAITCFILNITTFTNIRWSLPVVGSCLLLWVFTCPKMLWNNLPWSICLSVSALSLIGFEYFISRLTEKGDWFGSLALPITLLVYLLILLYFLLYKYVSNSILSTLFYFFVELGLLNVGIELLIDHFRGLPLKPGWSAIVLSVCAIISIALLSLMSISRLRNMVLKRLHF